MRMIRAFCAGMVLALCVAAAAVAGGQFFVGSAADIAGIKASLPAGDGASGIHVDGNFALLQMYDQHVSWPSVYRRVSGEHWKLLVPGGGVMGISQMTHGGVPAAIAHKICSGWPTDYTPCGNF
ncbi:MAG TPA: hypothetical protein VEJ20_08765 [Candidatus Eremiobacteraceae bacterium]|nr:hypothetical protein [Candidatus Eremiobacteraceae bacterium]